MGPLTSGYVLCGFREADEGWHGLAPFSLRVGLVLPNRSMDGSESKRLWPVQAQLLASRWMYNT